MNFLPKVRVAVVAVLIAGIGLLSGGPAQAQNAATINLLHGIPDTPVDVLVDGTAVATNFKFSEMKDLSAFAGQTLKNLEVRPTGTATAVIGPLDFPVPDSGNYTVLAYLDATGNPALKAFKNTPDPTPAGQGRLVVVHAAAAPAVDVVVGTDRPVTNLSNGNYKELLLPAGPINGAKIAPTGGEPIADVPSVTLEAGTNLNVFAVGSLDAKTFTFLTQKVTVGEEAADTTSTSSSTTSTTLGSESTSSSSSTSSSLVTKLPSTGSNETTTSLLAMAFLLLGGSLVVLARRRANGQV